ncbi:MAG: ABC transporter-like protein [Microgenomates group bacterium Gr01-1014_5]|nr:MAG: ABC transporter-like protein [Microgenomates group bacterium Gr01-1014_5]
MISVQNLSFSYGGHIVFDDISLLVNDNQKVGLVGPNGAGKSTLLGLISQNQQTDIGRVQVVGSIASVPQEIKHDPALDNSSSIRAYLDPEHEHYDFEVTKFLKGLELSRLNLTDSAKLLSGGQKTRLAIIRALLAEPDILILDEPTNYLDTKGKKWVMDFISTYQKSIIIVSHDLSLLDHSIDKILFINAHTKKIEEYKGTYAQFLKLREEKINLTKKQHKASAAHIQSMQEGLRMGTQSVKQRIQLQKRIEREKEKLPELPREAAGLKNIRLPEPTRGGQIPLSVNHISKSYGDNKILDNVNFYLERGEKLALIGKNGAGKSTLVKILVGLESPDSGEVVRDVNLKLGYYSQEHEVFDFAETVIKTIQNACHLNDGHIRSILGKFMFSEQKIYQTVGTLSGGEKTRLAIALLVLQDYNLLVLDEPTTYLDVLSQRIILEALKEYKGAMIIVSHTEEFIKELAPSRVLLLPENRIDHWHDEYLAKVGEV